MNSCVQDRGVEGNCLWVPRAKSRNTERERERQWKQGREEGEREIKLCRSLQPTSCLCVHMIKKKQTVGIVLGNTQEKGKEKHLESISDPPVVGQSNNWDRKRGSNNFPQHDLSCFWKSSLVRHCVGWNAWKQEVWFKRHLFNQHFLLQGQHEAACRHPVELFVACFCQMSAKGLS